MQKRTSSFLVHSVLMIYHVFCIQHNVQLTCTAVGTIREIVAVFAVTFHGHLELVLFICYAGVIVILNLNSIRAVEAAVMTM